MAWLVAVEFKLVGHRDRATLKMVKQLQPIDFILSLNW